MRYPIQTYAHTQERNIRTKETSYITCHSKSKVVASSCELFFVFPTEELEVRLKVNCRISDTCLSRTNTLSWNSSSYSSSSTQKPLERDDDMTSIYLSVGIACIHPPPVLHATNGTLISFTCVHVIRLFSLGLNDQMVLGM